jgi:hypothetical protein
MLYSPHNVHDWEENVLPLILADENVTGRFWALTERHESNDCILWNGALMPHGYGIDGPLSRLTGLRYMHRVGLLLSLGRLPAIGLSACHHCDNPRCVNPAHLYEGTARDNVRDWRTRGKSVHAAAAARAHHAQRTPQGRESLRHRLQDVDSRFPWPISTRWSWQR